MIKLMAIGRLTKDVEVVNIPNEATMKVANFTLACRNNKETEFIQCTAWNEVATTISANTKKGDNLYIAGKFKTKEWIDEQTQIKHKRIIITVEEFEFLNPKQNENTLL